MKKLSGRTETIKFLSILQDGSLVSTSHMIQIWNLIKKNSLIVHSANSNGFLASESFNFKIAISNVMNESIVWNAIQKMEN